MRNIHVGHGVNFFGGVRERAKELLQRDVKPGIDYALTEVVYCKSEKQFGVQKALKLCVDTYLPKVLEIASAPVIVVLGKRAKEAMQNKFNIPENISIFKLNGISEKEKIVTFLPHPSAFKRKTFANCLKPDELKKLRNILHSTGV